MPLKHGSSPSPGSHGIITLLTDNRLESFLQSSVSFAEQTLSGNRSTKSFAPTNFICLGQWNQLPRVSSNYLLSSFNISILKSIHATFLLSFSLSSRVVYEQQRRNVLGMNSVGWFAAVAAAAIGQRAIRFDKYNNKWLHGGRRGKKETLSYLAGEAWSITRDTEGKRIPWFVRG